MTGVRRILITKLIIALCIVSQVVAALPHHHHDGEMPCYISSHCINDTESEHDYEAQAKAESGCTHQHNQDRATACQITHLDIIEPTRGDDGGVELFTFGSLGITLFIARYPMQMLELKHTARGLKIEKERINEFKPLYTQYIVVAIPPRAPSFTA